MGGILTGATACPFVTGAFGGFIGGGVAGYAGQAVTDLYDSLNVTGQVAEPSNYTRSALSGAVQGSITAGSVMGAIGLDTDGDGKPG